MTSWESCSCKCVNVVSRRCYYTGDIGKCVHTTSPHLGFKMVTDLDWIFWSDPWSHHHDIMAHMNRSPPLQGLVSSLTGKLKLCSWSLILFGQRYRLHIKEITPVTTAVGYIPLFDSHCYRTLRDLCCAKIHRQQRLFTKKRVYFIKSINLKS